MFDPYTWMIPLATFAVASAVTYLTIPPLASRFKRAGIVGIDFHKLEKPKIPEMCGLSIIVGITAAGLLSSAMLGADRHVIAAFLGTIMIAGTIGAIDDLKPLGPKLKPVLTALAAVPILVLGTYDSHPVLPLVGTIRLTVLYPALVPFAIAIPANAVNMLDVFNGSMSGTLAIVSFALGLVLALSGKATPTSLAFALAGSLLAFYLFNRYPARVFSGDTGSLAAGAAIGALSVIGRIEAITIVALTPFIMNAFYALASIGRLYERREIKSRPVRLREDGFLEATTDRNAPVTLTRLILAEGPLREQQVVFVMLALTALSSALAVLAFFLPKVM
jgi:UDP-N-acetylmuramyl pentapeptide phosphotransferase/UDP-N-acetylglucosamine-1-phosphate transferase